MQPRGPVFDFEVIDECSGRIILKVDGQGAHQFFAHESGGHRWQRIPPTEKRGRVQTSTVTVAVLPIIAADALKIRDTDLEWQLFKRASGPGGQHMQKSATACRIKHIPTGIVVECVSERSQFQNRRLAYELLCAKIANKHTSSIHTSTNLSRKEQIGSGMRGDKIRTYREADDTVIDHRSARKTRLSLLRKGNWSEIK